MGHSGIRRHVLMVGRCRSGGERSLGAAERGPRVVVPGWRIHAVVDLQIGTESKWLLRCRCRRLQVVGLVQAQASPRA